jgi:hypothetical protein
VDKRISNPNSSAGYNSPRRGPTLRFFYNPMLRSALVLASKAQTTAPRSSEAFKPPLPQPVPWTASPASRAFRLLAPPRPSFQAFPRAGFLGLIQASRSVHSPWQAFPLVAPLGGFRTSHSQLPLAPFRQASPLAARLGNPRASPSLLPLAPPRQAFLQAAGAPGVSEPFRPDSPRRLPGRLCPGLLPWGGSKLPLPNSPWPLSGRLPHGLLSVDIPERPQLSSPERAPGRLSPRLPPGGGSEPSGPVSARRLSGRHPPGLLSWGNSERPRLSSPGRASGRLSDPRAAP